MKKLLGMAAALLFVGGLAYAEQPAVKGWENYRLYRSTNVQSGSNKVSNSAFLHKVIISSPSAPGQTISSMTVYDAQGSDTNQKFSIQVDTNNFTGAQELTFDIYLASGMRTAFYSGGTVGSVQLVYNPGGTKSNYNVYSSSFIVNDATTHTICAGPVLLKKIIVLKKGAGAGLLGVYNQASTTTVSSNRVFNIDLSAQSGEYNLNAMLPTGLTIMNPTAGTTAPEYVVIYKRNFSRDEEYWSVYHSTWAQTTKAVFAGRGVLGGIVNGDVGATDNLKLYDSNGTATNLKGEVDGDTQFGLKSYDVQVSSGLTFTNVGTTAQWSILYRRGR